MAVEEALGRDQYQRVVTECHEAEMEVCMCMYVCMYFLFKEQRVKMFHALPCNKRCYVAVSLWLLLLAVCVLDAQT